MKRGLVVASVIRPVSAKRLMMPRSPVSMDRTVIAANCDSCEVFVTTSGSRAGHTELTTRRAERLDGAALVTGAPLLPLSSCEGLDWKPEGILAAVGNAVAMWFERRSDNAA